MRVLSRETNEVRLDGALDVRTAADVRIVLHEAIDHGDGDLVVDLAGVAGTDTTGLGVLVGAHRRAGRRGRRLVLRNVPDSLSRLLLVTRLYRIMHIEYPAAA